MARRKRHRSIKNEASHQPHSSKALLLWVVAIITLCTLYFIFQFTSTSSGRGSQTFPWITQLFSKLSYSPKPDPARYAIITHELEQQRLLFAERYLAQTGSRQDEAIFKEAEVLLNTKLPELMRCWLGTPWDFHGTATIPGEGKIACGYFISTVLRDAGFQVERIKLAQQASQNIIETFLPRDQMDIQVGMDYDSYIQRVKNSSPGIHIVGLDKHVAFIVTTKEDFRFIHSSGANPKEVVDQEPKTAYALKNSRYRVIGNLTSNKEVLRKWFLGESFPTHTSN